MGDVRTHDDPLVCDALKMALWRRKRPTGVIVHSDRGVQYRSHEYQSLLAAHGLICSMSKKRDCFDNAAMEGFQPQVNILHFEVFWYFFYFLFYFFHDIFSLILSLVFV